MAKTVLVSAKDKAAADAKKKADLAKHQRGATTPQEQMDAQQQHSGESSDDAVEEDEDEIEAEVLAVGTLYEEDDEGQPVTDKDGALKYYKLGDKVMLTPSRIRTLREHGVPVAVAAEHEAIIHPQMPVHADAM